MDVEIGDTSALLDPVVAGVGFSAEETVASLTGLDFAPAGLWRQIVGMGAAQPALVLDEHALEAHLHELASQAEVPPTEGAVAVATGEVQITEAQDGLELDEPKAAAQARESFLVAPGPWTLPTAAVQPKITAAETERAAAQIAAPLLSGPVSVTAGGGEAELPVGEFAPAALIGPGEDPTRLELEWDQELLAAAVVKALPEGAATSAVNARFVFDGDQIAIQDGTPGTALDPDGLAEAMTAAVLAEGGGRVAEAPLVESTPDEDRAALEALGVKEVVGRFETQATDNLDRTRNLRKASEIVTGHLVRPGDTFSLDQALGHRSLETGWFDAGVVVAGVSQQGIGGGLSQFSTTLYNAAHLAGMVDVDHTPHSNYFSRYPRGREATLWEGQIDNQFKNDTPYGVVLRAGVTDSLRVWVELWSTKYWDVEAEIGEAYAYTAPRTVESSAANCTSQAAGSSGFEVDYWRVKTSPEGEAQPREEWHWRYDPMNAIVCTTS
ncbi:MAG: VanW family protein [Bifidobacteriaceae bacterium]|nr:VanW family protein [Bifidobacteriaceae bacterium]